MPSTLQSPIAQMPVETLLEGDWLRMRRRGTWEFVERVHGRGMAVIIIAVTRDNKVVFVEQDRIPLGRRTIEMPAGLVGDQAGEDTLENAARRELEEETGYVTDSMEVLLIGPTSAGLTNERIAYVRAGNLTRKHQGGGVAAEDEAIIVHEVPLDEAPMWLLQRQAEGYELDLKLWGGLWMIEHHLDGRKRQAGA